MSNRTREILEGTQYQGSTEEVTYTATIPASWGTPTAPSAAVYSINESTLAETTVTATVMPAGSASVNGQVITLPELKSLTADVLYLVLVTFTSGANVFTFKAYIRAER